MQCVQTDHSVVVVDPLTCIQKTNTKLQVVTSPHCLIALKILAQIQSLSPSLFSTFQRVLHFRHILYSFWDQWELRNLFPLILGKTGLFFSFKISEAKGLSPTVSSKTTDNKQTRKLYWLLLSLQRHVSSSTLNTGSSFGTNLPLTSLKTGLGPGSLGETQEQRKRMT